MKRKYICIPVMVLMICALFPGMMVSGDCESCSTENVTPYTPEDLKEFSLEADVMLDMLSRTIVEKVDLLKAMLKNPPSEKDEKLSALIGDLFDGYMSYLSYIYLEATTETVSSMTSERDDYLIIGKTESINEDELERAYIHYEDLTRSISSMYDTLESYYKVNETEKVDLILLLDDIILKYDELSDATAQYAILVTKHNIAIQAEKQEFLTRSWYDCDTPGAGDSLVDYTTYEMTDFTWVKVWVGVYTSQSPIGAYIYTQYCTTTQRSILQHLAYANDTYGPWNVGSLQLKYFFLADQDGYQHNAIYEGNISNYNLNGEYQVGDSMIEFTNGVAWTYGATYDGYSTPADGYYEFDVNENWLYPIEKNACCIPSSAPDDTTEWQWCNKHCSGCFACDVGADQNFFYEDDD